MAESQEEFFRKLSELKKPTVKTKGGGNVLDLTHLEMPPSDYTGEITPLPEKRVKSTLISGPQEQAYKQKTPNPSKFISEQKINAIVTLISQQVENISETYQIRTGTQLTSRNIRKGSILYQMMKTSKKPSEGLATPGEQIEGHLSSVLKSSSDPEKPYYTFKTTKLNKPFSHDLKISGEATREIIRKRVIPMLFAKDKDKKSKFFLGKSKEAIEKMVSDQPAHGITYEVKMSEPRGEGPSGYEQAGFKNLPINVSGEDVGIAANRGDPPPKQLNLWQQWVSKLQSATGEIKSSLGLTDVGSLEEVLDERYDEEMEFTTQAERDKIRASYNNPIKAIESTSDQLEAESRAPKILKFFAEPHHLPPKVQRIEDHKATRVIAHDKGFYLGTTKKDIPIPESGFPKQVTSFDIAEQEAVRAKQLTKDSVPKVSKETEPVKIKASTEAERAGVPRTRIVMTPAGKLISTAVQRGKPKTIIYPLSTRVISSSSKHPGTLPDSITGPVVTRKPTLLTAPPKFKHPAGKTPTVSAESSKLGLSQLAAKHEGLVKSDVGKKVFKVDPKTGESIGRKPEPPTSVIKYKQKHIQPDADDIKLVKSRTSGEFVTEQLRRRIALKKSGENVAQGIGKGFRFGILGLPYLQIGSTIIQGMRLSKEKKKEGGDLKILDFLPDYAKKQYQQSIGTIPRS